MRALLTYWLAEVIEGVLQTACAALFHGHACWILNGRRSPFRRLYWWAIDARTGATPGQAHWHPQCPACGAVHDPSAPGAPTDERLDWAYRQGFTDGAYRQGFVSIDLSQFIPSSSKLS